MKNRELDLKESIVLDNDFRKWMDACDKLNEGVNVSDPEMQHHIDTYEKHLEKSKAPKAPGATTDSAGLEQEEENIQEYPDAATGQQAGGGTMGAPGMGTPGYAVAQKPGLTVQPALPTTNNNTIKQLKDMAQNITRNPSLRADPNLQKMVALVNQLK